MAWLANGKLTERQKAIARAWFEAKGDDFVPNRIQSLESRYYSSLREPFPVPHFTRVYGLDSANKTLRVVPSADFFAFWREVENLPRFQHLEP